MVHLTGQTCAQLDLQDSVQHRLDLEREEENQQLPLLSQRRTVPAPKLCSVMGFGFLFRGCQSTAASQQVSKIF